MAHTTRELLAQHFSRAAPPRGWFDAMAADKPPPRMYRPTASMELEYLALDEKSGWGVAGLASIIHAFIN